MKGDLCVTNISNSVGLHLGYVESEYMKVQYSAKVLSIQQKYSYHVAAKQKGHMMRIMEA